MGMWENIIELSTTILLQLLQAHRESIGSMIRIFLWIHKARILPPSAVIRSMNLLWWHCIWLKQSYDLWLFWPSRSQAMSRKSSCLLDNFRNVLCKGESRIEVSWPAFRLYTARTRNLVLRVASCQVLKDLVGRSFFLSSCSIHFGSFKSWTQIAVGPLTFAKTLGKNSSSHPVAQGPQGVCDTEI